MQSRPPPPSPPDRARTDDPAGAEALPLEELEETGAPAVPPSHPPVETALDDDEGGADPVDPDTGRPYDDRDPGTAGPPAERRGGTPET